MRPPEPGHAPTGFSLSLPAAAPLALSALASRSLAADTTGITVAQAMLDSQGKRGSRDDPAEGITIDTDADGFVRIESHDGMETDREPARFAPDCDGRSAAGEKGWLVPARLVVGIEHSSCYGIDELADGDLASDHRLRGNTLRHTRVD